MNGQDAANEAAYEKTIKDPTPLDPAVAAERLKLVKRIFDEQGVIFWIGSGTLLGAVREGRFILGTMRWIRRASSECTASTSTRSTASAKRSGRTASTRALGPTSATSAWPSSRTASARTGRATGSSTAGHTSSRASNCRCTCSRPSERSSSSASASAPPTRPEEYLRRKYGPEWRTPKGPGFESDVVGEVAEDALLDRGPRFLRRLSLGLLPRPNVSVQVFDRDGDSVAGAELAVAGLGHSRADARGIARFYVPGFACYAMTVTYPGHRELLYEEFLTPGANYTYRPGPIVTAEEHYKAGVRAVALVRGQAAQN